MTTGEMIKDYRKKEQLTLTKLAEKTGLSTGYLSLIERNQTTLTLVTLKKIALALGVSPNIFLERAQEYEKCVVIHQEEYETFRVKGEGIFYYDLSNKYTKGLRLGPQIEVILPREEIEKAEAHSHDNEEFGYILEGILTLYVDGIEYKVYPGDCFHFESKKPHALLNGTNKLVKILYVTERASWSCE